LDAQRPTLGHLPAINRRPAEAESRRAPRGHESQPPASWVHRFSAHRSELQVRFVRFVLDRFKSQALHDVGRDDLCMEH